MTTVCENCGIRPAEVLVRQRMDGHESTVQLCQQCALAMGALGPLGALAGGVPGGFGPLEGLLESLLGGMPARQDNVLAQLSEMAQRVLERSAHLSLEWGKERIGVEFVLLAMLQEVPEIREALQEAGAKVAEYEGRLEQVMGKGAPRKAENIALSSGVKKVLQIARHQSMQMGHDFIGPEHLLLAILLEGESFAAQFLSGVDPERVRAKLSGGVPQARPERAAETLPPGLSRFGRDLTALAKAGQLDPVIGRAEEINRVIRILSRKTKNNPVLVGEPGVGKTAIAEGLAQRIVHGTVPDAIRDKKVVSLDLGGLVAGSKFRGEFEERFKVVVNEIRALKGKIILFIDEVHTLVGAGAAEGAIDASSLLKPALARGELQCLGATTLDDYRKYIEKDAALERRFQPVTVREPTHDEALAILRGLRDSYEAHHRVKISDEAISAAVNLSERYVADRFLPDKAIDLMDEACAMVRLGSHNEPIEMKEKSQRLASLEKDKNAAVASERYEEAAKLRGEISILKSEVEALEKGWQERKGTEEPTVTPDTIAHVVSEWTHIPAERLRGEEAARLIHMEAELGARVVGQEEAVRAVSEAVRRGRAGLKDPKRPIGSFIFLGPTGVGKTETARALAEFLFHDESALIRFDMSEYMERHTVSRLVGAPPGYVGYEEAGKLTEAVRQRPYSVLLFDEVEKAHPDIFNILLQILDDGRLTDAHGRTVSFKNTLVVMTSNVGAERFTARAGLGFQRGEEGAENERIRDAAMTALREQFRPEFLNRLDEIIVFHPLTREQVGAIVERMLKDTMAKLTPQGISLEVTEAAKQALADQGFEPKYGARPLRRVIARELETRLSQMLLDGTLHEGDRVRADFVDGKFQLSSAHPTGAPSPEAHPPPTGP